MLGSGTTDFADLIQLAANVLLTTVAFSSCRFVSTNSHASSATLGDNLQSVFVVFLAKLFSESDDIAVGDRGSVVSFHASSRDALGVGASVGNVEIEMAVTNSTAAAPLHADGHATNTCSTWQFTFTFFCISGTISLVDADDSFGTTIIHSHSVDGGSSAPGGGSTLFSDNLDPASLESSEIPVTVVIVSFTGKVGNVRVTSECASPSFGRT